MIPGWDGMRYREYNLDQDLIEMVEMRGMQFLVRIKILLCVS